MKKKEQQQQQKKKTAGKDNSKTKYFFGVLMWLSGLRTWHCHYSGQVAAVAQV